VYFWSDGIYVQARLEDEAQCLLVIIGATPEGKKIAFYDVPAEHWKHLRTTNPIESAFATVRHRAPRDRRVASPTRQRWR
jgi:transposase-like protein